MGGADGGVGGSRRIQEMMPAEEEEQWDSVEVRVRRKNMTGWWTPAG